MIGIPKTTSGRLTMAALAGMAIAHVLSTLAFNGELPVLAIIMELILFGTAGLVMTGSWWAYAAGVAIAGLLFIFTITGSLDRLTDPSDPAFLSVATILGLGAAAILAGMWSAVRVRRGG